MELKTLQTITTIELSSLCNLKCKYCINRNMEKAPERNPGIMSEMVFEATLDLLGYLVDQRTQREVYLNGNGESLLDPNIVERVKRTKEIVGEKGKVMFCTNGVLLTRKKAIELKDAGLDRLDVSIHDAYHARRCAHMLGDIGMWGVVNAGVITAPHNWAGQIKKKHSVPVRVNIPCHPIIEGRGYVNSDGAISPCCYDYRNLGQYGHVFDHDILLKKVKPFSLCRTCHQTLPSMAPVDSQGAQNG